MADKEGGKKNQKEDSLASGEGQKGSTQSYLDIDQIREGIVILKDGSMRVIFSVNSINFELKSEMERDAIIYAYQNFLNSIDFPVQIIIQSRKLNLDEYLADLRKKAASNKNELLRAQTTEYADYVQKIITEANIMQKKFYISVPHFPAGFKKLGSFAKLLSSNPGNIAVSDFESEKKYLIQKAETVASGLSSIGLYAIQLKTQEIIELFYGIYNPEQAQFQRLIGLGDLEAEIIEEPAEELDIG